jgi:hypothetical protein
MRVITNESHPMRTCVMNNKIHAEYATKPRTIKPIFIRAIENLGQLQTDVRRIETTPYYIGLPWIDQSFMRKVASDLRRSTAKILEEKFNKNIKIYTDGSKKNEKFECVVIKLNQKFKNDSNHKIWATVLNKKQSSTRYTSSNRQVNGE